jgi:hypothetical protein
MKKKKLSPEKFKERMELKKRLCGDGGTGHPRDRNGKVMIFNPYTSRFLGLNYALFSQSELNFIENMKKKYEKK